MMASWGVMKCSDQTMYLDIISHWHILEKFLEVFCGINNRPTLRLFFKLYLSCGYLALLSHIVCLVMLPYNLVINESFIWAYHFIFLIAFVKLYWLNVSIATGVELAILSTILEFLGSDNHHEDGQYWGSYSLAKVCSFS